MPPPQEPQPKSLKQMADDIGLFPPQAFDFIEEGLRHTVLQIHGREKSEKPDSETVCRHVSGPQLCDGLRELALAKWGRLARTVLRRWNITSTLDFGRIVFALIAAGQMQKTDEDTLEDFRNVYDFKNTFETGYRIPAAS